MASEAAAPAWRSLHPASMAVNLLPRTWALVRGFWPVLLVLVFGGGRPGSWWADLPLLLWLFVAAMGSTVLHWATLRYRLADGRLELRSGLLNRQRRVFSPRKVQHVEIVRNVFHRLTGLAEVRIETASGDEVEGLLSALTIEEARRLVSALEDARATSEAGEAEAPVDEPVLLTNGLSDLVLYGATSLRLGWVFLAVAIGFEAWQSLTLSGEADAVIEAQRQMRALRGGLPSGVVVGLGLTAVVLVSWLGGIAAAVVRHHGLTLVRTRDGLRVQQGLTTTRRVELPLKRVQLVRTRASWLRRWAGFGSLVVETASAQGAVEGNARSLAMVPVVPDARREELLDASLPGISRPHPSTLRPPDPRALTRAHIRAVVQGLVVVALLVWRLSWWGLLGLAVPALLWARATFDHRNQGWRITDELVVSRVGFLRRTTTWAISRRVQSVTVVQGFLLRRYGLAQVVVSMAGGSAVALPLLDEDEAWDLSTTLAARVGAQARRRGSEDTPVTPPVADPA